jgi:hypothetical protein
MTRPTRKRQQSYNERRLAELQKQLRHEQQLMTLELDALAGRIGDLEEAYAKLPRWARTPAIVQRFVLRCVHEIEAAFAKSRMREAARHNKRPREIPRFTQLLIRAFARLEANSRPPLFAMPSEVDDLRAWQKDGLIRSAQGHAAAILERAVEDCGEKQSDWAERIAKTLYESGLACGKTSRIKRARGKPAQQFSTSAVIGWRRGCRNGTHHASVDYQRAISRMRTRDARVSNPKRRVANLRADLALLAARVRSYFGPSTNRSENQEAERWLRTFCHRMYGENLSRNDLQILGVEFP